MSLFKVTNWWSVQCSSGDDEEPYQYDSSSLYCCCLNTAENSKESIVVGSHSGMLSIFQPNYNKTKSEDDTGDPEDTDGNKDANTTMPRFNHSDVVLETKLSAPILQILSGKFSTGKSETDSILAVLHPNKLCLYQLLTNNRDQSKVQLINEYVFKKHTYSLCKGNFGKIKGKEFLCVQFMDGSLTFFEQDGIQYECVLPGTRNIPCKVEYVPRTDCFVTVSPSWELECFRYQDMAETNLSLQKNLPIWSMCIGEYALDINVVQTSNFESAIIILGENNLFCVSDTGKMKFIKRLDFTAMCLYSFLIGWFWEPEARLIICLVSDNGAFLIYENDVLLWCAQLISPPIALQRANLMNLPGAIVTLNSDGKINVGYLGSEPHLFKVPSLNLQQLDFESTQKELLELEEIIQLGVDSDEMLIINSTAENNVIVKPNISLDFVKSEYDCGFALPDKQDQYQMCLLSVIVRTNIKLEELQIYIHLSPPLECSLKCVVFRNMSEQTEERMQTWIYMSDAMDLPNLDVTIFTSFIDKQSIPRTLEKNVKLPVEFFFKQHSPQKESEYKLTLAVTGAKHELSKLFPGFAKEGGQAAGFKSIYSGGIVTIVAAKNSNRFRIQSDNLTTIPAILSTLIHKLGSTTEKMQISVQLPMPTILSYLDAHYLAVQDETNVKQQLDSLCSQFTLFQRCYITKLHDLQEHALDGIQMLIGLTQKEIVAALKQMDGIEFNLSRSQINLSCVLHLLRIIVSHLSLPWKIIRNLCAVMAEPINDWMDQSWEEIITPAIDVINRIGPIGKNNTYAFDDIKYNIQDKLDFPKFKEDLKSVLERVLHLAVAEVGPATPQSEEDGENEFDKNFSEWLNSETTDKGLGISDYESICLDGGEDMANASDADLNNIND